jgi:hypothetical protein
MAEPAKQLQVTSHVARDLLQSSAVFEHERLVVWEYVSNGLDYVDPKIKPVVKVLIDNKKKKITCTDNGRGMDFDGLHNFFTMHGENIDRKQKRHVRGFFGTGKSAAFGIASVLRVTTNQNGKRSRVELRKEDVEAASSGDPIPVRVLENEVPTADPNGTAVEIEKIHLKHVDQKSVIEFIERHLARWSKDATVFVNNHECEFKEPAVRQEYTFEPEGAFKDALGEVQLQIKVSKTPLEEDIQGISIFSNGVWYETTLAGSERKDQANLIFGEIDIPSLADQGTADIPAFDLSRRMKLNKSNPLVQRIHAFIGIHVEQIRKQLVEEEKERKKSEQSQKLKKEASKIAQIINDDFAAFQNKLQTQKAKVSGTVDPRESTFKGDDEGIETLEPGGDIDAVLDHLSGGEGEGDVVELPDGEGTIDIHKKKKGSSIERTDGDSQISAHTTKGKRKSSSQSGGFNVDFNNAGADAPRASYESSSRTIWMNLDHPQLRAALASGGIEDVKFRRLAYEVAFSEYAVGLVHEMNAANFYFDIEDAIYDVRETLNRISRAAAVLYSSD